MKLLRPASCGLAFLCAVPFLRAEQEGLFTYRVIFDTVEITDYPDDAASPVDVPDFLNGLPVSSISEEAFSGCALIPAIHMGSSVTSIADGAFAGCDSLTVISVDPANQSYGSTDGVLYDKEGQTLLVCPAGKSGAWSAPDGMAFVSDLAFSGCRHLTSVTLPDSALTIGRYGFTGCSALTELHIGTGVTGIGESAFDGCPALVQFTVSGANQAYSSPDGVLFDKDRTTLVRYPAGRSGAWLLPDGVVFAGDGAFADCHGLTGLTLADGLSALGNAALSGCSSLTELWLPDSLTFIGDGTFLGCSGLASLTLPDSVTYLGNNAFFGCSGLTQLGLGEDLTTIGEHAFAGCGLLTGLTLGSSVTGLGDGAFEDCASLSAIHADSANLVFADAGGVLYDKDLTTLIQYPAGKSGPFTVPAGVTALRASAFSGCRELTAVSLPDGLNAIGDSAFSDCVRLTSIAFPDSLSFAGGYVFAGCTGLTSASLGSGLTTLGTLPFYGCSALTSISTGPQNPLYRSIDGALYDIDRTVLFQYPPGKQGAFSLPDGVAFVSDFACAGCRGLSSVTLPDSLIYIGSQAFADCPGLRSALFSGEAPDALGNGIFANAAPGFTVYADEGRTSFTVPEWQGYPCVRINQNTHPAATWLLGYGLPWDADLYQEATPGGLLLLLAWALDVDPLHATALPQPALTADGLTLTFHTARPALSYRVETSTDLIHWSTDGVRLSLPGPDGVRTATAAQDGPARFLRLVVGE